MHTYTGQLRRFVKALSPTGLQFFGKVRYMACPIGLCVFSFLFFFLFFSEAMVFNIYGDKNIVFTLRDLLVKV